MASTPDLVSCAGAVAAPDFIQSPYTSLNYHFGMLLGVADLETEQAYHRGKTWLHNAWLHREGVVWGLNVGLDAAKGEIQVSPGLALDGLGRELHLEAESCVSAAAWFEAHRNDDGFEFEESDARIVFDAHIVLRFKSCLTRQVPAMSEPCENAGTGTAYSRMFETVEIFLRPGPPHPKPLPYHRLRVLFGLESPLLPADLEVVEAPRTLDSFRRFAALDEIDLRPVNAEQEAAVLLASVTGITLKKTADKPVLAAGTVHLGVRRSHVATSTIQELLCGNLQLSNAPVVIPASFIIDEATKTISFRVTQDLAAGSVQAGAFSLTCFDGSWHHDPVASAAYDNATRTVTVVYSEPLAGAGVRFLAHGSGPTPILSADFEAFNFGNDFVHMHKRS